MRQNYEGVIETWKVDIIMDRARKKGFRPDEMDDVQQEVVPAVLAFRFDPKKSNGATERTAITALVNNRLTFIQRGRARYRKHVDAYKTSLGIGENQPVCEIPEDYRPDDVAMAFDVKEIVETLPAREQAVCAALARGENRLGIARTMGVSRYQVDLMITRIRERFHETGLDGWVVRQ